MGGDVVIGYTADKTSVEVTASRDAQSVTVSQQLDDDNRVAPTLASGGAISVEWERSLGDDKSVTTTLKPDESIDVEWKDDAWTANINMLLMELQSEIPVLVSRGKSISNFH